MRKIVLPETDKKLLEECDIETFRSSGPGGQHVNKTESAVRLRHRSTGIVITCQQERSQHRNKMICIKKLRMKIGQLNYKPARRIPSKMPKSVRNRILEAKTRQSLKKKLRLKPQIDNE